MNNIDYRTLIRAALDGFWLLTGEGRFLDVNDAYCAMVGYTREELLSKTIAEMEIEETQDEINYHLQVLKSEGALRFETRHQAKDGHLVDIEISANYDPSMDRIFVFLRDITGRKNTTSMLQQRTQALGDRIKELRCLLDLNALLTNRLGLSFDEIMQQAIELLPPAWQYPAITAVRLILPEGTYTTENFQQSPWLLTCYIDINEPSHGSLMVVYIKDPPDMDDPFLPEEQALLYAVAQRLNGYIQRRRAEEVLQLRELSLNSLLDLSQHTSAMEEQEIIQLALEEVERLTQSQIGYLHFINPDQNSIHLYTWSYNTLVQCDAIHTAHYPLNRAGVWADCARQKRPVMHNDYQTIENKHGYPPGHVHLIRHLGVPVVDEGRVHLILGVGNKSVDYDEADVRQMQLTAEHLWRILRRKRAEIEATREAERMATLARVAAQLNAHLELQTVLQTICKEAAHAFDYPIASVCLYSHSTQRLSHTFTSASPSIEATNEVKSELLSLLSNASWTNDVFVLPPSVSRDYIGTMVATRLVRSGQTLGVLVIYKLGQPEIWEPSETALLRGLANLGAQAIVNARLFAEVSQSQEQLQTLSRRLVEVQEAERRFIAQELHDEVGQVLTAVKINLQILRKQPGLSAFSSRLDENIDSVQRALEQVRSISLDLRPSILDDLGLSAALEWYAQRLMHVTGLKIQLNLPVDSPRWSPTVEITCFRVAQEALTNILRHARAQNAWIDLQYVPHEIRMQVRDDGRGFHPGEAQRQAAQAGTSVGLLSMAERVALAGGSLEIHSEPGKGARVQVRFKTPTIRDRI